MRRRTLVAWSVVAICALEALSATPVAQAVPSTGYLIVPGHSIGKVTIGESTGDVAAVIGPPRGRSTDAGPGWLYGSLVVVTDPTQLHVVQLVVWTRFAGTETEAARYATRAGIHVGSTLAAVEKAYPKARCNLHNQGCLLVAGTGTTQFLVAKGKNELGANSPIIEISLT
jgi:hypothetical protein